ncbi:MAG: DUF4149 domain-containing protein [Burkholderiales bacterium]|nr:DUF4149 domain-containing protein [Burkholderiales bacterium]
MRNLADALQAVAATLWVGGLWVTGFMVAPVLFSTLPDRATAGLLAGKLFGLMAWIGIGCALYLLLFRFVRYGAAAFRQAVLWMLLLMLALVCAGEFGVQPVMAALREEALPKQVMESVFRDRFATWHGVASGLYVIQSLLGVALVILLTRRK